MLEVMLWILGGIMIIGVGMIVFVLVIRGDFRKKFK